MNNYRALSENLERANHWPISPLSTVRAMEIGLIAPVMRTIPPQSYGAIETYVDLVAHALTAQGHTVTVATTGDSTVDAERIALLPSAEVQPQGNISREFLHTRFAYEQMKSLDAIFDFTSVGPLLVHPDGPNLIVYVPGGVISTMFEQARNSIYEQCGPEVSLFTSAESHALGMPEIAPPHVVKTGYSIDGCQHTDAADELLFIGSIRPESRLDELIDAVSKTPNKLVIAGRISGEREEAYFANEIQPKLGKNCLYIGEISNEQLHDRWINTRALLVAEPILESTGALFLQAQAHGVSVVAPSSDFIREYTEPGVTSYLFESMDQIGDAIDELGTGRPSDVVEYVLATHSIGAFGVGLTQLAETRASEN